MSIPESEREKLYLIDQPKANTIHNMSVLIF